MTSISALVYFCLPYALYVALLVGSLCYLIHYKLYINQIKTWEQCNIPFLPPTFLLGHKYFKGSQSPLVPVDRIYRENPDKELIAFFMNTVPVILLRDPKIIQKVFTKSFDKAFLTGFRACNDDDVEAQNMISPAPSKELWKIGRAALAPLFSTTKMDAHGFTKIKKQIDIFWRHCEDTRLSGQPLNVKQAFINFTVDEFSHRQFGQESNSYEKKDVVYQISTSFWEPTAFRMLSLLATHYLPCLQVFDCLKLVPRKFIDAMTNLLQRKMADRDEHGANENDFIDHLRALRDGKIDIKVADTEGVNMRQMVGFGLLLAVAGTETVTILSLFLAHLLSLNVKYQERIREEIEAAMRKHRVTEFTAEVVQDLQFTEQCLMETARLYPATHATMRVCSEDFQIPGTEYCLREGDRVIMDPYSIHRDPQYYKNPDKFDPERFSPENRGSIPPEHFLTFSTGPRKCPGVKIGVYVASALIGSLVYKYELRPRSHLRQTEAIDFNPQGFVLQPKEDLLVDLIPREIVAT